MAFSLGSAYGGCALRSRLPRSRACQEISSTGLRACGARTSLGGSPARMALRGIPGVNGEGGFLGGALSPRRHCKAGRKARHNMIVEGQSVARWPEGDMPRWGPSVRYGRAEPAPPRGGLSRRRWPSGEKPGNVARRRFCRRGALCASAFQGLAHAEAFHYARWLGSWPLVRICLGPARAIPACAGNACLGVLVHLVVQAMAIKTIAPIPRRNPVHPTIL